MRRRLSFVRFALAGALAAAAAPGAASCVPRGDGPPGPTPPGTDAAPPPPPPPTDAGPPRSHWGWLLVQDHETVGDAVYARFYERDNVPLPDALLEGPSTAVPGAPGCYVDPLDAYPLTGIDAGFVALTGLAGPATLSDSGGSYVWTGSGDLFTGVTWGFAGNGTLTVAPFAGTDEPPDVMALASSVYDAAARAYTATWAPGNGTHLGVVAVAGTSEVVCLTSDAAGSGTVPTAAIDAVTPAGDVPALVGVLRMRVVRHGDPDESGATVVFSIGKSGYLVAP
jgi:hypothetical protein